MKTQGNSLIKTKRRTDWLWLAGSFVCLLLSAAQAQTVDETTLKRCGTSDYEKMVLQVRNPNRLRDINELNRRINEARTTGKSRQAADETVYRIPVVVHVVHNNASNAVGGSNNANISDEQIASEIQVLNEDYRRKEGTNGFNTSSLGADAKIEFFLATTDPNGQPTSGITRHYYPQKTSFDIFTDDVLLSQIVYWPSDRYLNIWVTSLQNNYLGYTQFPTAADTLKGLPGDTNEFVDGSMIDYRYFGRRIGTVTSASYSLGRTATHEIGHWLGLIHTWGDGDGCAEDYVADTPPTKAPNQTTQCRTTYSTCVNGVQTRDLTEDYMDYSPDACMNLFTKGQVDRMRAVLQFSPRRAKLIRSVAALPETEQLTLTVYPNPASSSPTVDVQLKGFQSFSVELFDMSGRQLRTMSYTDAPSTRVTVSTNGLPTGVYIVRVKTGNETSSARLLVQ
ncbi:M43 family zinc metalloprotease [Spirosoma agri]|uniref:T9SS type A sorting domain-containing protein n=1 Tax=Spirosoma agri TaxID=1987381 RepID=A0A6M0IHU6_9BACT|nr:M43 family zinc metalloprotease [Spirosoma agri]NEU67744.1 T9SS type A sorting domain-containing protein [Spirosoma agri]